MNLQPFTRLLAPLASIAALLALVLLLTRSSETPEVLGRWSLRYAYLLSLATAGTLALLVLAVPAWRARLLRRSARPASMRQAWTLLTGGLLLLPVAGIVLQALLPVQENSLMRALLLLTLCGLILPVLGLMHRSGAGYLPLQLRRPWLLLLLIFGIQIALVIEFHGQVPALKTEGEIWNMGSGLRQFHDVRSFISLSPDRNGRTWFHFFALWPFSGAFMQVVGAGLLQARFFYLLVGWLALPFLYLSARKRYGQAAALATVALASFIPLHYNWAVAYIQVPVATSIALTAYIFARAQPLRRPLLLRFLCGFFAVAAVDGHPYGVAFALMFCLLHLAEYLRGNPAGARTRAFLSLVAGCASYTVLWAGYHIALPGLTLSDLPGLLQATWAWEASLGAQEFGVGLTPGNVLNMAKLYLYHLPHELLLALFLPVTALLRRRPDERSLLFLLAGSVLLIGLMLGHVNEFYFVFLFPFISLWFGAWLAEIPVMPTGTAAKGEKRLSFMATYLLCAVLVLYIIQTFAAANFSGAVRKREQLQLMSAVGREIDEVLPAEDVVVAGQEGYYLGMPQRLNYGSSFSFTWEQPEYWPLAEPQAIIVTFGVDDSYTDLDRWLFERDFRPARCFAVPGLGDGVAILYLLPELMPEERAIDCAPEDLAWLAAP